MATMLPLVLLLTLLSPASAAASPAREAATAVGQETARLATSLSDLPPGWERARAGSDRLLGASYVLSPLGEGEGVDPDPRLRWDAFDCVTFVETSLALGHARDEQEVLAWLDDIRYREGVPPAFESRLHLPIAQWIPELIRKGYVEEATARFGETVEVRMDYDEARWATRPRGMRPLPWLPELEGSFQLPMLPMETALAVAPTLPEGLVINVVRAARADRLNRITHTGLIVIHEGKRFVRHASQGQKKVVDEPIERFLRRHAAMRRWTVEGIHLLAIRSNEARAERVLGGARLADAD